MNIKVLKDSLMDIFNIIGSVLIIELAFILASRSEGIIPAAAGIVVIYLILKHHWFWHYEEYRAGYVFGTKASITLSDCSMRVLVISGRASFFTRLKAAWVVFSHMEAGSK